MGPEINGTPGRSPKHLPASTIWLLVIGLGLLGYLSVYQYGQMRQLRSLHQQEIDDRARTTRRLVGELQTLNRNLAGQLDEIRQVSGRDNKSNEMLSQRLAVLDERVNSSAQRMDGIVKQYTALEETLAAQSGGVCLVEGEYNFVDPPTGKPLRFADPKDDPHAEVPPAPGAKDDVLPVSTDGRGDPIAVHYTGTGFLVDSRGYILTNHHVIEPWRTTESYQRILKAGYEARMTMLRVFFPNQPMPFAVHIVAQAQQEDVALIQADLDRAVIPVLDCEDQPDALKPGQRVTVLGYPTGFDLMLARLSRDQLRRVLDNGQLDFDHVARNLALQGLIQPTATGGMCSRVGEGRIVYDAQSAIGGSGAPVLGGNGKVVAINTALLKSFSGSNFGVPIRYGLDLLHRYAGAPEKDRLSTKNLYESGHTGR